MSLVIEIFFPSPPPSVVPTIDVPLPPTVTLTAGDTLTLTCVGSNQEGAISPLFFRWRFDTTLFTETDAHIINEMNGTQLISTLTIQNVSIDYHGDFACYLSNRHPEESRNSLTSVTMVTLFCKLISLNYTLLVLLLY